MKITGDICKDILGEQIYKNVYLNNEKSVKNAKYTVVCKNQNIKIKVIS